MSSIWTKFFPPKATWGVDQIPDLAGKVIIVTGGNTGIGKDTVRELLLHNAKVYIAGRSQERVEAAIEELKTETGKEALFLHMDLANLTSIKLAVEEFRNKETQLHVLFNSAGVMTPPIDELTYDGYDLQFGTNVLGHFYLTKLLLPLLIATAKTSPDGKARVINTSSMSHEHASGIDYDSLRIGSRRKELGTYRLYCQSKFGNVVFSNELNRRYASQGIVSISLHPGIIKTELARHSWLPMNQLMFMFAYPSSTGALTQLYAGTSPEGADLGGKYLMPWARVVSPRTETDDPSVGSKLWTWLDQQVDGI
ncbi:NAD-P-binding protein [Sparassis latifolia]|uniref:Uncharacterized oxidoreductase n=1 Tax=Sparassis crispa TaxID=139825 RepID=A0A401GUD0_9APHY|nr:Uncharacterized oxidoreductase [Sparassis crispa]GBE85822.1 Uncharacterized oxidoreductase [Sparassis crispa]